MLNYRNWFGAISAPMLLVTVGCSISHHPYSATQRGMTSDRMMSMAQTYDHQGNYLQAKIAYLEVLAVQPTYPNAQQSLNTLIAKEIQLNQAEIQMNQTEIGRPANLSIPLMAQSSQDNTFPISCDAYPISSVSAVQHWASPESVDPVVFIPPSPALQTIPANPPVWPNQNSQPTCQMQPVCAPPNVNALPAIPQIQKVSEKPMELASYVAPEIDLTQIANIELRPFFAPFQIGMVQGLKNEREKFQGPLAALVADHNVESGVRSRAVFLLGAIGPEASAV